MVGGDWALYFCARLAIGLEATTTKSVCECTGGYADHNATPEAREDSRSPDPYPYRCLVGMMKYGLIS